MSFQDYDDTAEARNYKYEGNFYVFRGQQYYPKRLMTFNEVIEAQTGLKHRNAHNVRRTLANPRNNEFSYYLPAASQTRFYKRNFQ